MTGDAHQKVNAGHLKRNAYLYVRQSTIRQVFENTESTKRQYALRQHAVALGWQQDQIIVIDSDLGQSGASAADREGPGRDVRRHRQRPGRRSRRPDVPAACPADESNDESSASRLPRLQRHEQSLAVGE